MLFVHGTADKVCSMLGMAAYYLHEGILDASGDVTKVYRGLP